MSDETSKNKRSNITKPLGNITQDQHAKKSGSMKVTDPMLTIPDSVMDMTANDPSVAPVKVGVNNILRIRVTAATYIQFTPDTTVPSPVPSITSPNTLELPVAGTYNVVATDNFLASSSKPTRVEIYTN